MSFVAKDGHFFRQVEHNNGKVASYSISNIIAWVTDICIEGPRRHFVELEGMLYDRTPLRLFWLKTSPQGYPGIEIQLSETWGIRAILSAPQKPSYIKGAIKWYSLVKHTIKGESRKVLEELMLF